MTEQERVKMIKEMVSKATVENPQFQEALSKTAETIVPTKPIETPNIQSRVFGSGVSFLELFTLVLLVLKLTSCAYICWFLVFLPLGIEILMSIIEMVVVYYKVKKQQKKQGKE